MVAVLFSLATECLNYRVARAAIERCLVFVSKCFWFY
jgi:hypothetical protein